MVRRRRKARTLAQRWAAKVILPSDPSGCWGWSAAIGDTGYARIDNTYAHRVGYLMFVGDIPKGMHIDHLCRNRQCVNPEHMEVVTVRTNVLRGVGPTAINAARTRCKRGHELSGDNLYVRSNGYRLCRKCSRIADALPGRRHVQGVVYE